MITGVGLLLGIVVGAGVIIVGGSIAMSAADYEIYEYERTELVALVDNSSIDGHFFLGSGQIDEDRVYVYMYNTEKGFTTDTVNANNCYINTISDDETPCMIEYRVKFTNGFVRFLIGDMDSHTSFYLPEGSITSVYEIDLK